MTASPDTIYTTPRLLILASGIPTPVVTQFIHTLATIRHERSLISSVFCYTLPTVDTSSPYIRRKGARNPKPWVLAPSDSYTRLDSLHHLRAFEVRLRRSRNTIQGAAYQETTDHASFLFYPQKGLIDPGDFELLPGSYQFDAVLTLGFPSGDAVLGALESYDQLDMAYDLPFLHVSLDTQFLTGKIPAHHAIQETQAHRLHHDANAVDAIDTVAGATALYRLIALATAGFRSTSTTAADLALAATCIALGADHHRILSEVQGLPSVRGAVGFGSYLRALSSRGTQGTAAEGWYASQLPNFLPAIA